MTDLESIKKRIPSGSFLVIVEKQKTLFDVYVVRFTPGKGFSFFWINQTVQQLLDYKTRNERLIIEGTGFDKPQHIAESLGVAIHGDAEAFQYDEL